METEAHPTRSTDTDTVKKLSRRTRDIEISDQDADEWDTLQTYFVEHYNPQIVSRFCKQPLAGGSGGQDAIPCLFSDLFSNEEATVLCGLLDGTCKMVDLNKFSANDILVDPKNEWKHKGLSCLRCSRVSPFLFFSSSTSDGVIRLLDTRMDTKKPAQKFATNAENPLSISTSTKGTNSKDSLKPILHFDVSCNDQLLCGGTEMVQDDSYLLFWDTRSSKLFGAYWESHSDDVTSINFHPNHVHSLTSGSTDGLLNVFNLLESAEEDALQYSFNTDSSVDCIKWYNASQVACVTHTNEIQIWDAVTGDRLAQVSRRKLADAMKRSNPDAVHITSCHIMPDTSSLGLLACSLSGGNSRLIEFNKDLQPVPRGLFVDQSAVIQTAENLPKNHQWITFDDNGAVKLWKLKPSASDNKQRRRQELDDKRRRKRFKHFDQDQN